MSTTSSQLAPCPAEDLADALVDALISRLEVGLSGPEADDDPRQVDRVASDHRVGEAPIFLKLPRAFIFRHQHRRPLPLAGVGGSADRNDR
jgi:hypothetical protein